MSEKLKWLSKQLASSEHTKVTGWLGEAVLMEHLGGTHWQGYRPKRRKIGDILAIHRQTGETVKIEVKTAKRGKSGRYNFCLNKNDRHGQTCCHHSDVVVLVCVDALGGFHPYVIPVQCIPEGQQRLTISSHPGLYTGKYAKFKVSWAFLQGDLDKIPSSMAVQTQQIDGA